MLACAHYAALAQFNIYATHWFVGLYSLTLVLGCALCLLGCVMQGCAQSGLVGCAQSGLCTI